MPASRRSTSVSAMPFSPLRITLAISVVARATTGRPIIIASITARPRLV